MAKGYDTNREHKDQVASFGKILGKRAGFRCEWCQAKDDLRPWEYLPGDEPSEEMLALLCVRCRAVADGAPAEPGELHALRNALWSDIEAVAGGAGGVLMKSGVPWAREAVEECIYNEGLKERLFKYVR
jgi:hypothetical protein